MSCWASRPALQNVQSCRLSNFAEPIVQLSNSTTTKLLCREPSPAKIVFVEKDPLILLQMERFHTISKCIACCLSLLPQRRACASASCLCLVPQPRASALCLSLVLCTGSLRTSAPNRAVRHELKTTAQCGAALPSATRAHNDGKGASASCLSRACLPRPPASASCLSSGPQPRASASSLVPGVFVRPFLTEWLDTN